MAKNTTKFPQAPGTNASGGIKVLDLSSIEDDLFSELEPPKSKGVVEDFKSGFKEGFLGAFSSKNIVQSFVKSAAPEGFSRLFGAYDSLMDSVSDVKSHIEKTNASDLLLFSQKTNSLLPYIKDKIPTALYGKISATLEGTIEDYKYEVDSQQRYSPIRMKRDAEKRKEEEREKLIKEALDHNSLITRTSFMKQEQGEVAREARRSAEGSIRDNISKNRFDFITRALSMSTDSLTKIAAYNEQVQYGMQRKGLELQFRTLLGVKDLVTLQTENIKLQENAFKAIVRNTALPDHKKKNYKELMEMTSLGGKAKKVGKQAFKSLPMWLAGYRGAATDKAKKSIGGTLGSAAQALRMGEGADLGEMWDQRYELMGNAAGGGAADFLKDRVAPWFGRQVRPELEKAGDRYMGGRQHQTSYILDNIPALLSEYVSSNKERSWAGNQLKDFLEPLVPRYDRKATVDIGGFNNMGEMASFNEITQRSIVDVIPGYLSRILQEIRILRSGDATIEREVYDSTTGKFSGFAQAKDNLLAKFISHANVETTSGATAEAISEIDKDGKLSDKAKKALGERLIREANSNTRFDPEKYAKKGGFGQEADDETIAEINDHFRSQFKYGTKGEMLPTADNFKRRDSISNKFLDIKSSTVDPAAEILKLIESGNTATLREMGILETERGVDKINYKKIWGILADGKAKTPVKDTVAGKVKGFGSGMTDKLSSLWGQKPTLLDTSAGTLTPDAQKTKMENINKTNGISDIWSPSNLTNPLIKAGDFSAGTLFDVTTGKVVKRLTDIKGALKNQFGHMVLTPADIASGVYTQKGQKLDLSIKVDSPVDYAAVSGYKPKPVEGEKRTSNDVDWYFDDYDNPVITVKGLKTGEYYDSEDKPITDVNDIKGPVYNRERQQIVSKENLVEGLWNKNNGERVKVGRRDTAGNILGAIDTYFKTDTTALMMGLGKKALKVALGAGIKVFNAVKSNRDGYFRDSEDPVITTADMKRGKYYNEKGNQVTSFYDHYGHLYDEEQNIIVDKDKQKELINIDGSKHQLAKNRGLLNKTLGRLGKWYGKKSAQYMKWATKKVFNAHKWGLGKIPFAKRIFKGLYKTGDEAVGKIFKDGGLKGVAPTGTDLILGQILDTLKAQAPEKLRDGGWKEQAADKAESLKDKAKDLLGKKETGIAGLGFLGGLKNMFTGKGGEDDEEEDDDGYSVSDGLMDASNADDLLENRRNRKRRKPKKPKGRFGRLMQKLKGGKALKNGARVGKLARLGRFAMTAGRVGLMAAPMLANGVMAVGGAIASVLSAPVVLGALAVAAVGVAGYYGYKYLKNKNATKGDFRQHRLMLYGFTSTSEQAKVLEFEDYMEPYVSKSEDSKLSLDAKAIEGILKIFDIDAKDDPEKMEHLKNFIEHKFKPLYLKYMNNLYILGQKGVKINDLDEKLPDEFKLKLLEGVTSKLNETSVFDPISNPFEKKTEELKVDRTAYDKHVAMMKEKFAALAESKTGEGGGAGKEVVSGAVSANAAILADKGQAATDPALTGDPVIDNMKKQNKIEGAKWKKQTMDKLKDAGTPVLDLSTGGFKSGALTSFQAIRLRAYGLETLTTGNVSWMLRLEEVGLTCVKMNGDTVQIKDPDKMLLLMCSTMFGLEIDQNTAAGLQTNIWLMARFISVLKAVYVGLLEVGIKDISMVSDKTHMLAISNRVLGAMTPNGITAWEEATVFENKSGLKALKEFAQIDLKAIEALDDKDIMATPTQSASNQAAAKVAGDAGQTQSFMANVMDGAKNAYNKVTSGVKSFTDWAVGNATNLAHAVGSTLGVSGGTYEGGSSAGTITEGNGGDWEKIPYPAANKSASAARPTFLYIEQMTGVPAILLHIFCSMESNFDYTVRSNDGKGNYMSTASGWFQFINKTWDGMLRNHGDKFGIPKDTPDRKLRLDPRINALMGAMFIKDNSATLRRNLKREPNDVDLYCAHFMGAVGASGFLSNPADAIAAYKYPDQAAANPSTFKDKGRARTFGEIYQIWEKKVAVHRATWGGAGVAEAAKPADPNEIKAEPAPDTKVEEGAEGSTVEKEAAVGAGYIGDGSKEGEDGGKKLTAREEAAASAAMYDINKVAADKMTAPISATPSNYNYAASPETGSKAATVTPDTAVLASQAAEAPTQTADPRVEQAMKTNALRETEIRESMGKTMEHVEMQKQQLAAVLDMQMNLRQLVAMKAASANSGSVGSPPPAPSQQQSRAPASTKGLVPLK